MKTLSEIIRKGKIIRPRPEDIERYNSAMQPVGIVDAAGRPVYRDSDGAYVALEELAAEPGQLTTRIQKDLISEPAAQKEKKRVLPKIAKYAGAGLAMGGIMLGLGAGAARAEENSTLEPGYNALEAAVTHEFDLRSRLLSNLKLDLGPAYIGYHGLNQANGSSSLSYFGRNTLYLGIDGSKTALAIVTKATQKGMFDKKIGVRDYTLMEKLGGFGWLDLTLDLDSANLTGYYGKALGDSWTVELMHSAEAQLRKKTDHYTEIQINKGVAPKTEAFLRTELPNFHPTKGTYLMGVRVQF